MIFSRSSVTGPNDVFILRDLRNLEAELTKRKYNVDVGTPLEWKSEPVQVTHFTDDALKGRELRKGESFYFDGAEGKKVQGWVYKPKGFKEGEEKKPKEEAKPAEKDAEEKKDDEEKKKWSEQLSEDADKKEAEKERAAEEKKQEEKKAEDSKEEEKQQEAKKEEEKKG